MAASEGQEGYFWYCRSQLKNRQDCDQPRTFCRLDDGRVVEYTEMSYRDRCPSGKWSDYEFLGHGRYEKAVL